MWTYDNAPGTDTAAGRRDAVRLLIGDTDTNDQLLTDEEIAFYLSEANDRTYYAAAASAKAIAAKYARLVTNSIDSASVNLSDRMAHYDKLSMKLEREAKTKGSALGVPVAGGISDAEIRAQRQREDRPQPAFEVGKFRNPPTDTRDENNA